MAVWSGTNPGCGKARSPITDYINLGDDYDKVRKVYSIIIVYFELGQGRDYVCTTARRSSVVCTRRTTS